jgi:selenocysteine-specific elongation factor
MRVERRGAAGMSIEELQTEMGIAKSAFRRLVDPLLADKSLVCLHGERFLSRRSLRETMSRVLAEVRDAGGRGTSGTRLKRAEIESRTRLSAEVLDYVLESLAAEKKLELAGELVRAFGSGTGIGDDDKRRSAQIAELYSSAGLTVPLLKTVEERLGLKEAELRRLMTLLLREKTLIKLGGDDIYMHKDVLAELYARMRSLRGQSVDIARFKEVAGVSRKYAIPLLEHLDRERITRRVGEVRLVV